MLRVMDTDGFVVQELFPMMHAILKLSPLKEAVFVVISVPCQQLSYISLSMVLPLRPDEFVLPFIKIFWGDKLCHVRI